MVFKSARSAVAAAAAAQRSLAAEPWPADVGSVRVRMGLHTGEGTRGGDNYIGVDVNRAARIAAAAHGGQVLLSKATAGLTEGSLPDGLEMRDLGEFRLKDLDRPERLIQLDRPGAPGHVPAATDTRVRLQSADGDVLLRRRGCGRSTRSSGSSVGHGW